MAVAGYRKVYGHELRAGDVLISGYRVKSAEPSGETNAPTMTLVLVKAGEAPREHIIGDHETAWRKVRR